MGSVARSLKLHGGLPTGTALTMDNAFKEILNVKMDDAADTTGGATTQTVGFQITDFAGDPIKAVMQLSMVVFTDQYKTTPATLNGALATAVEGTILNGSGTETIDVITDANGRFSCTLTKLLGGFPETLYVGCLVGSGALIDCREIDSITFSA